MIVKFKIIILGYCLVNYYKKRYNIIKISYNCSYSKKFWLGLALFYHNLFLKIVVLVGFQLITKLKTRFSDII